MSGGAHWVTMRRCISDEKPANAPIGTAGSARRGSEHRFVNVVDLSFEAAGA
jgi:hypothetical protein